jgi:hypothetical protein
VSDPEPSTDILRSNAMGESPKRPTAGYTRISRDNEGGASVEQQTRELQRFADEHRFQVAPGEREPADDLLDAINSGDASAVVYIDQETDEPAVEELQPRATDS